MAEATARRSSALAGRYAIERELGAEGLVTVYHAKDLRHDREVAIEVLRPELTAVLGAERFLNEFKVTTRLDHPHIILLIASGAAEGLLDCVLPFMRGESLRERLRRGKQPALEQAQASTTRVQRRAR